MAVDDPARTTFAAELRRSMAESRLSAQQLADILTADTSVPGRVAKDNVENWRRRSKPTFPPLALIPAIARVVNMRPAGASSYDPLYVLRRLGLLEDEPGAQQFIDSAWRLQKLQLKLESAQREAVSFGRAQGAARIVQAALRTREWAVAVWPAIEGPPGYPMHVADRIDIRRVDGAPIERADVWAVRDLKDALRAAYAVLGSRLPRWSDADPSVSQWSIAHIGAPSGPLVATAHEGLPTLAFSAATLDSWVHDVASLTSLVLGYGLTTTRDLAMEISGRPSPMTRPQDRAAIHDRFLLAPPARRVWSHHGPVSSDGSRGPFTTGDGLADPRLVHVRLVESDELLTHSAERRNIDLGADAAAALTADRDRAVQELELVRDASRTIRLDVADHLDDTSARWTQVLDGVRQVITALHARGLLGADLSQIHAELRVREPGVAPQVFDWLAAQSCPLVHRLQGPAMLS